MRDRRRWLGGPLGREGRELPRGPAVGAGAQGVVIQEGSHSHPTGSDSGWVRRATKPSTICSNDKISLPRPDISHLAPKLVVRLS